MARPGKNIRITVNRKYIGNHDMEQVFTQILTQALYKIPPAKPPEPYQPKIPV